MERTGLQWSYTHRAISVREHFRPMGDTTELHATLSSLPLFKNLDEETLRNLVREARIRSYQEGEIICYQGDSGVTCHIILKGKVRIYTTQEDGRELCVHILGPGEIVGEMAIFENLPRSANVEALEETTTMEVHRDTLIEILLKFPTLALSLLQAMSARLRSSTTHTGEMATLPVSERLMQRLHQLAKIAGKLTPDGVRILLPMTQQELADMVGTSRESVNRALAQLRRQGKIRLDRGWVVILNELR